MIKFIVHAGCVIVAVDDLNGFGIGGVWVKKNSATMEIFHVVTITDGA